MTVPIVQLCGVLMRRCLIRGVELPRYVFQPDNAVPIGTFIDNMEDRELMDILPVLLAVEKVADVRQVRARIEGCGLGSGT